MHPEHVMRIAYHLSALALRQVVGGACEAVGLAAARESSGVVVGFLTQRFSDHSQRLTVALRHAGERGWKTLEVSLAGRSLWDRCKAMLAPREEQAFRLQVQAFLDATPLAGLPSHGEEFRQQCLRELRAARKAGVLDGMVELARLAEQVGDFARFSEPTELLDAEWKLLDAMGAELREAGYGALGHYVGLRPNGGPPLLAAAVRYFFRRLVEEDRELFQGLAFAQLESLGQDQEAGFAALTEIVVRQSSQLEGLLADVHAIVVETHGGVLDIKVEVQRQGQQLQELGNAVLQALANHRIGGRNLHPGDSLSIHNEGERHLVKQLVARFRALPATQQRQLPAILNGLGLLEAAAGELDAAQHDFREAATLTADSGARAAAQHNAYQAALEQRQWEAALTALQDAMTHDAARWAPFPLAKYEPQRILGAGGFGVAFLCRHRNSGSRVVVKSLRLEGLDRDLDDVFREAQVLEELDHPAIIRLRDCDYADGERKRPFLVMEFFDGATLADHVAQHGPLPAQELLALARPVADALQAAHARGILHRDVKPANLLVRKEGGSWRVKLIDFGLALKQSVLHGTMARSAVSTKTIIGCSVAGTLDYAAPEQLGRLPGVKVGPPSDVYGFARTCCFALFKTVQPLRKHWRDVPEGLADLLEQCLSEAPEERPGDFGAVAQGLEELRVGGKPVVSTTRQTLAPKSEPVESPREKFWAPPSVSLDPVLFAEDPRAGCFKGHTDAVTCVDFSVAGRYAVSGGRDATVRVWDLANGKEYRCFTGHTQEIGSVSFLPDGGHVMSASEDTSVRCWKVATGVQTSFVDRRTNRVAAISRDGLHVLSGSLYDGMLRLWNLSTGEELRRLSGHRDFIEGIAFLPNGNGAVSSSKDQTVRTWDLRTGRQGRHLDAGRVRAGGFAVSPDSRFVLVGGPGSLLSLWDLRDGRVAARIQGPGAEIISVAHAPDGCRALSGAIDGHVWLWDLETGQRLASLVGHEGPVHSVAFSPDGSKALTGGADHTVRLWDLPR